MRSTRAPGWSIYRDPDLDRLEREVDVSNQTLAQAVAAYQEAQAVGAAGARQPVSIDLGDARRFGGKPGPARSAAAVWSTASSSFGQGVRTNYSLEANASWDVDVWGKIRRTVESDVAGAQASAADIANARLSAAGDAGDRLFQTCVRPTRCNSCSTIRSNNTSGRCRSRKTSMPQVWPRGRT